MSDFMRSSALIFGLFNPFLLTIYLIDMVQRFEFKAFSGILFRAALISIIIFSIFALIGDAIFSDVIQAEFASFQIFGGIVFLLIGLKFMFKGPSSIEILRGEPERLVGVIVMPFFVGPGTISASVLIGKRLEPLSACLAIALGLGVSVAIMIIMKKIHDNVRSNREPLVQRYIEISGRITALYVGTIAIEMIMHGFTTWLSKLISLQ
jgi:multiple antibiotic resistance protein